MKARFGKRRLLWGAAVFSLLGGGEIIWAQTPSTPPPPNTQRLGATTVQRRVVTVGTNHSATGPRPIVMAERFRRVGVAEFEALRTRPDAVVLDVRTAAEFAAGHLPKAGLADVQTQEFLGTVGGLDRSKLYLINCAAGVRSARACQSFAALGFTNVVNLEGGFNAWKKEHADLVSREPAVALPRSATPNMRQSGTASTPPPAQPAPATLEPIKVPLILKPTPPAP